MSEQQDCNQRERTPERDAANIRKMPETMNCRGKKPIETFFGFILTLAVAFLAAVPASAQSKCESRWPHDGFVVGGSLNGQSVRLYLDMGYPAEKENGVSGIYLFPDRSMSEGAGAGGNLWGALNDDCSIEVKDSEDGIWRLRIENKDSLKGTREFPSGTFTAVSLTPVHDADCGPGGPWRHFSASDWPITFDYPASWRLSQSDEDIDIECPSIVGLAWGGTTIRLHRGGEPESIVTPQGERGSRFDEFVNFGAEGWYVGESCEAWGLEYFDCTPARESSWRGMTVLQGSGGENRRYRPGGGYVGQGDPETVYLFLAGGSWVTVETPDWIDGRKLEGPGPVICSDDELTDRFLSSIQSKQAGSDRLPGSPH